MAAHPGLSGSGRLGPAAGGGVRTGAVPDVPSFSTTAGAASLYSNGSLGYLPWRGTWATTGTGRAPVPSDDLAGIDGGPVVLFDDQGAPVGLPH